MHLGMCRWVNVCVCVGGGGGRLNVYSFGYV